MIDFFSGNSWSYSHDVLMIFPCVTCYDHDHPWVPPARLPARALRGAAAAKRHRPGVVNCQRQFGIQINGNGYI